MKRANIFTRYGDNWINREIDLKLRLVTDAILGNISGVRSIILAGGFGKGEGSVEIADDGSVRCLRDFDIVAIVDRIPKRERQQRLYDDIYRSLALPNPEDRLFRFTEFVVGVYFRRKKDLIYPDIWFYDLKAASQLLYGEDVRGSVPWGKRDIPLSSGLRILFEKVCGLLGLFSPIYVKLSGRISEEQRRLLIFECYKTFIEICTALCILAGRYEPRYASRADNLEEFYFDEFPDFARAHADLPRRVKKYTDFKLKPDFRGICEDPVELWFLTRDTLGSALRLYFRRYNGTVISEWSDLPQQMRAVAEKYYNPFLGPFINAKLRFSSRTMLRSASLVYQALANVEYAYVVSRDFGRLYLRPLSEFFISPSLKFFAAGIMLLFSLHRDGTVERELSEEAARELRHCIPVEISRNSLSWEALRNCFLRAYSLYRGFHLVK